MHSSCGALTNQSNTSDEEQVRMSTAFSWVVAGRHTKYGGATEQGQNDNSVDQQWPVQEDERVQ